MTIHIYPKKKICIFCNKKVNGFFSYYMIDWEYKEMRNDTKQGIDFLFYENPYHIKCAKKLVTK